MKDLYLVDTPLQLLNSILHKVSHDGNNSDICIVDQFKDARIIAENIKKSKLFENVVVIEKERKGKLKHVWTLLGLILPNAYTKFLLGYDMKKEAYNTVYLCAPTKLFDFIIAATSPTHVYGIEDGIGSYYGDIFTDYLSKKYIFVRRILKHDYSIDKLFINNKEIYEGVYQDRVALLEKKSIKNGNLLESIFPADKTDELYKRSNFVYLNQPVCDFEEAHKNTELRIIKALYKTLGEEIVVRLHPRETETYLYQGTLIDSGKNMWELVCMDYIDDNSILIGMSSTAQFVPKFMYDREPFVVFTYKLYKDLSSKNIERYEKLYEMLKSTYRASDKVICVASNEELVSATLNIKKTKLVNG